MKITTRGGDGGETSLGNGTRVPKDDVRVALVGTLDECQAHVGMARAIAERDGERSKIAPDLLFIERELGLLMGHLTLFPNCDVPKIEPLDEVISKAEERAGEKFRFLPPGESVLAAALHLARTVARRAERVAAPLVRGGEISPEAARYLNRLSDYFYALGVVS